MDGNLYYTPFVSSPTVSETLPVNQYVIVHPGNLASNITLTLPATTLVGSEYLVFGSATAYTTTVSSPVTAGSPYIGLPDGSQVYSWEVAASSPSQGVKIEWDGTNYHATTFGPTVVAPAVANNQAVQLGQVVNGVAPVAANVNGSGTTGSATTGALTAPCDGYALVIGMFSSGTSSLSGTSVTSSLSGFISVMNPNDGNYFNISVGYLPMTAGQSSTFTCSGSQATSGAFTYTITAFFQPNP